MIAIGVMGLGNRQWSVAIGGGQSVGYRMGNTGRPLHDRSTQGGDL